MASTRGYYWRGPVVDAAHAVRIVKATACWFVGLGVLLALPLLRLFWDGRVSPGEVVVSALLISPAVAMLRTQSLIGARILFWLFVYCAAMPVILVLGRVGEQGGQIEWTMLIPALACLLPVAAARRAAEAAHYLKQACRGALLEDDRPSSV